MIIDHRENDEFLEQARQNKIPQGLGINNALDQHLRFKQGSFNIILGHSNVGKTFWVMFYLLCLSKIHKKKHLIYSAENTINGLKRNLIELYAGKYIKDQTKKQLETNKAFIEDHFDFIDHKRMWHINEFMKNVQLIDKTYDSIMIDPINAFQRPRGVNAHENDYETASKLRLYAKKFNTTIYVCMHAATEALRKVYPANHEYAGLPQRPNAADAEGGGKWQNRADDMICLHRMISHSTDWMYTQIHCLKIKETQSGGSPTFYNEPVLFKLEKGLIFSCEGVNSLQ